MDKQISYMTLIGVHEVHVIGVHLTMHLVHPNKCHITTMYVCTCACVCAYVHICMYMYVHVANGRNYE